MTVTVLSAVDEQRMRSLRLANETRFGRARTKRQLASGEITAATVAVDPPWHCRTMTLTALLLAIPGWGPSRVRKAMRQLGVGEGKTLGALTGRQRQLVAAFLEERT